MNDTIVFDERTTKLVIFLIVLLIIIIGFGSFYLGTLVTKEKFILQATYQLEQLLWTNFSYVCGSSHNQIYLNRNITLPWVPS